MQQQISIIAPGASALAFGHLGHVTDAGELSRKIACHPAWVIGVDGHVIFGL